jgi:hypothetical protein
MNEQLAGRPQLAGAITTRAATVAPATINDAQRTFEVVWTTGAMVRRYSWMRDEEYDEALVVDDKALRLEALNSGAPFLETHRAHDLGAVLGVVVEGSVRVEGGKGHATIRLSDRDEVEPLWRDIKAGIIRRVSVGYRVHKFERVATADRKDGGNRPLYRAVDWEPLEISAVAIGADPAAGIRGDHAGQAPEIIEQGKKPMTHATTAPDAGANTAPSAAPTIRALVAHHNLGDDLAEDLIGRGLSEADARQEILDKLADRDPMQGRSYEPAHVGGSWEGPTGTRARLADGLLARLDPGHEPTIGREFHQRNLGEVCAEICTMRGERVSNQAEAVRMCTGRAYHTTSDFALITADAMSNLVARQFEQRMPDLARASREVMRITYHEGRNLTLSSSGMPEEIEEAGEIQFTTMDEKGELLPTPRDFGAGFNLSNKAIANDRLDLLSQAGARMVRGAVERMRRVLLEPIEANGGHGMTMASGQPMFDALHGNLADTGSLLSIESLSEARLALRTQTGLQGELYAIQPWALVVPADLETTAQQLVAQIDATKYQDSNPFSGALEVIVEPGLSDPQAWYLIGNPAVHDGLAHAFLDAQRWPRVETRPAWETLGLQMRLIWAIDAKFIETAAWFKNPGASPV